MELRESLLEAERLRREIDDVHVKLAKSTQEARSGLEAFYRDHHESLQRIAETRGQLLELKDELDAYERHQAYRQAIAHYAKQGRDLRLKRCSEAIQQCNAYADATANAVIQHVSLSDLDTAMSMFNRLWHFRRGLQAVTKSMTLELNQHHRELCQWTWNESKRILYNRLLESAAAFEWPSPIRSIIIGRPLDGSKEFTDSFIDLLRLQEECPDPSLHGSDDYVPLYPIQALLQPIILRFRFHFDRKTSTNRIDKPEWMYTQVINTLQEHSPFMRKQAQALLKGSPFEDRQAWNEMATILQSLLVAKVRIVVPVLLPKTEQEPNAGPIHASGLLSHLVYQTLQYDSRISSLGLKLAPLVEEILGNKSWFDAWLKAEREFAINRYEQITFAHDAWHLDTELQPSFCSDIRPSQCVRQLSELLSTITDRYRPLPSFKYQAPFLLEIQVYLLEAMESRLSSVIEAFDSSTSTLLRAVASTTGTGGPTVKEDSVAGLVRMARCWTSAMWLASFCKSWSDDGFFLVLWQKITETTKARSAITGTDQGSQDGIFYAMAAVFAKAAKKVELTVQRFVVREIKAAAKEYLALRNWHESSHVEQESVTPQLFGALQVYANLFGTLAVYMPAATLTSVHTAVVQDLTTLFHQRLIERNAWSSAGSKRLIQDIEQGWMLVAGNLSQTSVSSYILPDRGPDFTKPSDLNLLRKPAKAWNNFHVAASKLH